MPPAEYKGCGAPSGGARPRVFRNTDEGPMICVQDRAVICGGIIIGIIRQKTSAPLRRRSVSATRKAKVPPINTEITVPKPAVISEWRRAERVAGLARTSVKNPRLRSPPAVMPSKNSRATGASVISTATARMSDSSRPSDRLLLEFVATRLIPRQKALQISLCWHRHLPVPERDQRTSV